MRLKRGGTRRPAVPVLTTLVLSVALSAGRTFPAQPVADWIRAHAIRLSTPEAGHGFDDLQPLKTVIGSARIVSLGEATHGTREFFQLKHRMLEFLVTEMGFTIFSIEANMPEAYRLNDHVLNGAGDPARLLKGMYFWTWDTEEVLAMIRWMHEFNQSGKGRVEFTGFDMQIPTVSQDIVRGFVTRYDSSYATKLEEAAALVARVAPCERRGRQDRSLHRLHQDGRDHSRLCRSVVSRERRVRHRRVR